MNIRDELPWHSAIECSVFFPFLGKLTHEFALYFADPKVEVKVRNIEGARKCIILSICGGNPESELSR